jgi:hypothetical protein
VGVENDAGKATNTGHTVKFIPCVVRPRTGGTYAVGGTRTAAPAFPYVRSVSITPKPPVADRIDLAQSNGCVIFVRMGTRAVARC